MVSRTVGCDRPAGQPGELGLGVVGSQRSVSYGGVLRSGYESAWVGMWRGNGLLILGARHKVWSIIGP